MWAVMDWVSYAAPMVVAVLAAAFLLWLWWRHRIVSAGWLALYELLPVVLVWREFAFAWYIDNQRPDYVFGMGLRELMSASRAFQSLLGSLAWLCVVALVAADVVTRLYPDPAEPPPPKGLRWLEGAGPRAGSSAWPWSSAASRRRWWWPSGRRRRTDHQRRLSVAGCRLSVTAGGFRAVRAVP
jgi:hypothetical protein